MRFSCRIDLERSKFEYEPCKNDFIKNQNIDLEIHHSNNDVEGRICFDLMYSHCQGMHCSFLRKISINHSKKEVIAYTDKSSYVLCDVDTQSLLEKLQDMEKTIKPYCWQLEYETIINIEN